MEKFNLMYCRYYEMFVFDNRKRQLGFPIPVLNTNCLVTSKISLYVRPQNLCILTIYGKHDPILVNMN